MKRFLALALTLSACGGAFGPAAGSPATKAPPANPNLLLATTTSTQDSGLLDVLIPDFEKRTGYRVKTSAVGTGQALAIGERGDADVVLVHAPSLELDFMAKGAGDRRLLVMHNDFILVGPPDDPARVKGVAIGEAFKAIAAMGVSFISRGDKSGTDTFEKSIWQQVGITPDKKWYVEAGVGMGQTLTIASEKRAYTVTDRGTFLARRGPLQLDILVEQDVKLLNVYHVITVNAQKFPRVNKAGADAFADYLVAPETQQLIGSFGVQRYGQPLFFPDAGKREEDVGR
ncbi:MAG TPA: substrate-binding domain-containing protein [Candidatus Limnocylindria bacterium]|nr:substrate-binding domain-containing protein [Candidatus Limnocylindria bacterium]